MRDVGRGLRARERKGMSKGAGTRDRDGPLSIGIIWGIVRTANGSLVRFCKPPVLPVAVSEGRSQ
eukprot:7099795-Prymnesium_polylepis.1